MFAYPASLVAEAERSGCDTILEEWAQADESTSEGSSRRFTDESMETLSDGGMMPWAPKPGTLLLAEVQLGVIEAKLKVQELSPKRGSLLVIEGGVDNVQVTESNTMFPPSPPGNLSPAAKFRKRRGRGSLIDQAASRQEHYPAYDHLHLLVEPAAAEPSMLADMEIQVKYQLAQKQMEAVLERVGSEPVWVDEAEDAFEVNCYDALPESPQSSAKTCASCAGIVEGEWKFCRYCGFQIS